MSFDLSSYEPVEDRIRAFWEDHPEGAIMTKLLEHDKEHGNEFYIVSAEVYRGPGGGSLAAPDATGLAHESVAQLPANMKASALEVCETSAIGRALANLGYAPKGKRPSREEMSARQEPSTSPPADGAAPVGADMPGAAPTSSAPANQSRAAGQVVSGEHRQSGADLSSEPGGGEPNEQRPPAVPGKVREVGAHGTDSDLSSGGEGPSLGEGEDPNPPATSDAVTSLWNQLDQFAGSRAKAINAINKVCKSKWTRGNQQFIPLDDLESTLRYLLKTEGVA